jgi:chemotaxis signal transduction protein
MTTSIPTTSTASTTERTLCLLFRSGGERFAIRAADVQKVTPPGQRSQLPRLPVELLGITQHRGRVVTVVDAAAVLGAPGARTVAESNRLLLLERPVRHLGLMVDAVDEIESLRLPADLGQLPRGGRPMLRVGQQRGRAISLIDVAALVEQITMLLG